VLVFSNFSTGLVAIAVLALLADRMPTRLSATAAAVGIALCAAVFWPGVVDQANLDAKPVNGIAALGVLVAVALTALAARGGRLRWSSGQPGDRVRAGVAAAALLVGLPWLAAELGFFLNGVPGLGRLYQTGEYRPRADSLPPFPPAVHHGHHHGMDGVLLLLSALLLSRVVPAARRRSLRVAVGVYLSLMVSYAVGNIANDFWIEQVVKRGWTTWMVPDVLRPKVTIAWGLIVLGTAAVYVLSCWWTRKPSGRQR
jgi:hypothetical protein